MLFQYLHRIAGSSSTLVYSSKRVKRSALNHLGGSSLPMRVSCQQDQLHRGLSAVSRAVPARSVLPITQHVLVEADEGRIKLSATDAETIAITYTISATVGQPGAITV